MIAWIGHGTANANDRVFPVDQKEGIQNGFSGNLAPNDPLRLSTHVAKGFRAKWYLEGACDPQGTIDVYVMTSKSHLTNKTENAGCNSTGAFIAKKADNFMIEVISRRNRQAVKFRFSYVISVYDVKVLKPEEKAPFETGGMESDEQ